MVFCIWVLNRSAEKLSQSQRNFKEMGTHQGFLLFFFLVNCFAEFFYIDRLPLSLSNSWLVFFFFWVLNHLGIVDCCQILNGFWNLCLAVVILCCRWFHKLIEYLFVLRSCLRYDCFYCLCSVVRLLLLFILIIALECKILEVITKLGWVDCLIKLNLFPNEAMLWVVIPTLYSNICGYCVPCYNYIY